MSKPKPPKQRKIPQTSPDLWELVGEARALVPAAGTLAPRTKAMGRPTRLNPVIHRRIVELIAEGNYFTTACRAVGIDPEVADDWLTYGKKGHSDPVYYEFYRDVTAARIVAERNAVKQIMGASQNGDWKAGAWWLARGPAKQRWGGQQPSQAVNLGVGIMRYNEKEEQAMVMARVTSMPDKQLEADASRLRDALEIIEGEGRVLQ